MSISGFVLPKPKGLTRDSSMMQEVVSILPIILLRVTEELMWLYFEHLDA